MQTAIDNQQTDLTPIGSLYGQNGMPLTQTQPQTPTKSQGDTMSGLSKSPPLVNPVMFPDDIIRSIFTVLEFETLIDYLEKYQKKRPEWDEYRAKIPEEILNKWCKVLKSCKTEVFRLSASKFHVL